MRRLIAACVILFACAGRSDAQVEAPWHQRRAPRGLTLKLEKVPGTTIAQRATEPADFRVARAGDVEIDARFGDWAGAEWISMTGDPFVFGENVELTLDIDVPAGVTPSDDHFYLGFNYDQMDRDYEQKYLLDGFYDAHGVVVTSVEPGSPAAESGLREGDVIFEMAGRRAPWGYQLWQVIEDRRRREAPQSIALKIRRSGVGRWQGPDDLSARFAFLVDDEHLYFAAQVTDDVHAQKMSGWDFWKNDCLQIGFDPTLERLSESYGEDNHEIGLVLKDGKPLAWRWKGRRAHPDGMMPQVAVAIAREGGRTLYEAAIPLAELAPLSPDMWPHCGIDVVVNDSDDGFGRKARLELRPGAITNGKYADWFADFELAPSDDKSKISLAWFWDYRTLGPNSRARMKVALCSPTPTKVRLLARLESAGGAEGEPARAEVEIPVTPEPEEWWVTASTRSPPGEWRLEWVAVDPEGAAVAQAGLPIFIKP